MKTTSANVKRVIERDENIAVRIDRKFSIGMSFPWADSPTIRIGARGFHDEVITAIMAHELGHILLVRSGKAKLNESDGILLGLLIGVKREERSAVIKRLLPQFVAEEFGAWRVGFAWLKKKGFRINKEMKRCRRILMDSAKKKMS
jgi:hypothetical protein